MNGQKQGFLVPCFSMFHMLITVSSSSSILLFFDVVQIRCNMDVFEDYSKTPLLLRFECVDFRVFAFKLCHNVCDGILWLDFNLFIYDFYFVFANGDFL
jgi:hypothetical protein